MEIIGLFWDTRGGIGKSLQLKHFKHTKPRITLSTWFPFLTSFLGPDYQDEVTEENLVQMFGNHLGKIPPFFQEFTGDPNTTKLFRNAVFAASEDYAVYDGENGNITIKLTSPTVNGIQMIKTFEAVPDSYILNYRVQLINRSTEIKPIKANYFFGEQRLSDNGGGMHQVSHEGPVFFYDGSLQTESTDEIENEMAVTMMKWLGVEDQYFIGAVAPETTVRNGFFRSGMYFPESKFQNRGESKLSPYFGVTLPTTDLKPNLQVESN
jgi:hypothetical protein